MSGHNGVVKKTAKSAASTNKTPNSLVKVVVTATTGKWISPSAQKEYYIGEDATFPSIVFEIETADAGPYVWSWTITWEAKQRTRETGSRKDKILRTLSESGVFESGEKTWTADLHAKIIGGKLTLKVDTGSNVFQRSVTIKGKNPGEARITELLKGISDVAGFESIIEQESNFKNFIAADGEPLLSFDGGYGLTQMTNPAPSYEEIWNWEANVKGGSALYQQKQKAAKTFLGKNKRAYTSEQLKLETWSRWNGGSYHVWDDQAELWKRNENMLCDSNTGNIGWDVTASENRDKSESELRTRDKDTYANPKRDKTASNKWKYTGVCYADHLNDD